MTQEFRQKEHNCEEIELRELTEAECEECSFYVDSLPDGLCLVQHKYYRWGDTAIFAVGELNHPNAWDEADFSDTCSRFEAALNAMQGIPYPAALVASHKALVEALEEAESYVLHSWTKNGDSKTTERLRRITAALATARAVMGEVA